MKKGYVILILLGIILSSYFLYSNRINNLNIIIVGTNTPPFEFYNKDGKLVGIDIEFLNRIFEKLNLKYSVEFMNWDEAINEMGKGNGDIILGAGYSKDREKYFSYTEEQKTKKIPDDALWIEEEKIFYREKDNYNISSLKDIEENKYRLGIVNGYLYYDDFWNYKLNIYSYENSKDLTLGLDNGEVDLIMADALEGATIENTLDLKNKIVSNNKIFSISSNLILFSKKYDKYKYKKIRDNFYTELIKLKDEGFHEELYKKYTGKNFTETYGNLA